MTPQERIAWYNLAVALATLLTFLLLLPILGMPRAMGAFAVISLSGLTPLLALRWRGSREPIVDERDRLINSRSTVIAYSIFWVFFVLACMAPYTLYGAQAMIHVETLLVILTLSWVVLTVARSVATIIQYRRGNQHASG